MKMSVIDAEPISSAVKVSSANQASGLASNSIML